MFKTLIAAALLAAAGAASAHEVTYNVTTTWFEPDTQPKDSIFTGSFEFDEHSHTVSNLKGLLSESMTGTGVADMTWVALDYQLVSTYDAALGGTLAAVFAKNTTSTFMGNVWAPADGIDVGGVFAGGPAMRNYAGSVQNSYALIFVPDDPTAALTQAQINKLAYADCAPGGMMGAVCMTGTSLAGYGAAGTMSGYPVSQTITAAVPEPGSYALLLSGLGVVGFLARRRRG